MKRRAVGDGAVVPGRAALFGERACEEVLDGLVFQLRGPRHGETTDSMLGTS